MTYHEKHYNGFEQILKLINAEGSSGIKKAVEFIFNTAMALERSQHLQAEPYERTSKRLGHANGFKPKAVQSRFGELHLEVPQVRDSSFYPNSLEKGLRSERALKLAIAQMYVQGVSTRKVAAITEKMCGFEVTSSQVSRAAKSLDEEINAWKSKPLGKYKYVFLDAIYQKVRCSGQVLDNAVLLAVGVDEKGKREVLGLSSDLSEAEAHWRNFLKGLQERGMHGIELIVSDAHIGLKKARQAVFPSVAWQRCQFHLQQNVHSYITKKSNIKKVHNRIRSIFLALNKEEAMRLLEQAIEDYKFKMPRLAAWMEENIPEGLAVFDYPEEHRRRIRTSNNIERLNREIRRRTKTVSIFPNVQSCERLIGAILIEQSEEWQTGKIYLKMEN